MLLNRRFAFIHLPKTGGAYLKKILSRAFPDSEVNAKESHLGCEAIPPAYESVPWFGLIRNPWDWYVSWYHYLKQINSRDSMWLEVSKGGTLDFEETTARLCEGRLEESNPRAAAQMRRRKIGLLSMHYLDMYEYSVKRKKLYVGRAEYLAEDFLKFLTRHRIEIPPSLADHFQEFPRFNASVRGPYRNYYSKELKKLVGKKERFIIRRYGYRFGDPDSKFREDLLVRLSSLLPKGF